MVQEVRKENSISTGIKFALLITANCLLIILGITCITLWVSVETDNEKRSYPGLFSRKEGVTLNQDITIVNPDNHDESITLKKDSVVNCDYFSEMGVLYSEDHNGVHYHEYLPFDYFVEGEELKEIIESHQNHYREVEQVAMLKKLCFSSVYLAICVPVTVILFKKKKYRTTIVINFILMLGAFFISMYIYSLFH